LAGDAVALLDVLDLARAHVIGHDWGGFTVVNGCSHWMLEERPDLIADQARALFG
jgi:pimeloyl-ACP methyl ester carboxylesterase